MPCACAACKKHTGMALASLIGSLDAVHTPDCRGIFVTVKMHNGGPFLKTKALWDDVYDHVYDDDDDNDSYDDVSADSKVDPNVRIV